MKYTKLEQYENGTYGIYFTDNFYNLFERYYQPGNYFNSYFNILFRLFGLLPQDFYHMVGSQYKAIFQPDPYYKHHIRLQFKTKQDGEQFLKEIDRRIEYFAKQEDFI